MTGVRAVLDAATATLGAAGVDSARVDAELLLAAAMGVPRPRLLLRTDVPDDVAVRFAEWVRRRAAREPLQHIVGTAPFRYLELQVGPGVFVPRPETELLVDAVLPRLREVAAPLVADLCAGSGALGLAVLDEAPAARGIAVEVSPEALAWLSRNAAHQPRLTVLAADVRDATWTQSRRGHVDAVVANPPYVPDATPVTPEVHADPAAAVFAGADGLALIPAVAARAAELLRSGGVVAVEHDDSHAAAVPAILERDGRFVDIADHADLTGRPRYATAVRR